MMALFRQLSLLGLAAMLAGAMAMTACANQDEEILILRVPGWPDGKVEGTYDCVADPDTAESSPRGRLDLAPLKGSYMLPLVVMNNLLASVPSDNSSRIEDREIMLEDAVIRLGSADAADMISNIEAESGPMEFRDILSSTSLLPQQQQGVFVEVVPPSVWGRLRDEFASVYAARWDDLDGDFSVTITAQIVLHGRQFGRRKGWLSKAESREYVHPIEVCWGCLANCTTCADKSTCDGAPGDPDPAFEGLQTELTGTCGSAQDGPYYPCGLPQEMKGM